MRDLIYIIQLVLFALSVIMFVSFGLALSDKNKFYKCSYQLVVAVLLLLSSISLEIIF